MRFFDAQGNEKDEIWAKEFFGKQIWSHAPVDEAFRLIELREHQAEQDAVLCATFLDGDGAPVRYIEIAFVPKDVSGEREFAMTDDDGIARFSLGPEHEFSAIDSHGKYAVIAREWACDGYDSAGQVMKVQPKRWLNPVFQWNVESEPPPPEEPPFPLHDLRGELSWHSTKRWEKRAGFDTMVVHHTASEVGSQTVRDYIKAINRYHIESKDWARIGYHYLIGKRGVIWHCNDVEDITFHSGNEAMNRRSIGVCFVGDLTKRDPTEVQLYALRWLRGQFDVPAIGHKEVVATACPGDWWPGWKAWVNGEQPVEEHLLTTSVVGSGTILLTPPGPYYPHGTEVMVEASPAAGWTFTGWIMGLTGLLNPTTLVMDGDKTVKALFTEETGDNEAALHLAAEIRILLQEADDKMVELESLL